LILDSSAIGAWRRGLQVVAVLGCLVGLNAVARTDESPAVEEASLEVVTEEELEPTMESNRRPLGPNPLVLPQWSLEENKAFDDGRPVNLGGGLWTADRYPLQPVPPWPAPVPPTASQGPGPLGWELMAVYGSTVDWCVDPQGVLEAGRRARLEKHLQSHAARADHPVRLWMLAAGQSLSESLENELIHQGSFGSDRPGILAVCAVNDPLAARIILPPALDDLAVAWRDSVIARVATTAAPADPLETLVLWMTLEADSLPSPAQAALVARQGPSADGSAVNGESASWVKRLWWALVLAGVVGGLSYWRHARAGRRAANHQAPEGEQGASPVAPDPEAPTPL
jgi:hypothetical protein